MASRGTWPGAGEELLGELHTARGRIALIRAEGSLAETTSALAHMIGEAPTRVGQLLAEHDAPPDRDVIVAALQGHRLLTDLDVLFSPQLRVDPVALLRRITTDGPVIAVWPGRISGRRATYSEAGRPDHYDAPLSDALVLTPVSVAFPDEIPYELERIPA